MVTAANLTGSDQGSGSSITTASISPGANQLLIVSVTSKIAASTPNVPTVTGDNFTWVQIATQLSADNHQRTTLFRGMVGSPASGALTVAFGGQTQDGANWAVDQFTGADTSGTNGSGAIVQSVGNTSAGSSTGITVTLGSFASGGNATHGYVFINSATLITEGTGFTELQESGGTSGEGQTQYKSTADTTVDWTWANTSLTATAIAIEVSSGGHILTTNSKYW